MSKRVQAVLSEGEFILNTSKGCLTKMLPFLTGAVFSAGTFVATGIPSAKKKPKIDRSLLEIYLCLTNKRLMIWKTTWYGSPKEIWISIDLEDIENIKMTFSKVFWKLPTVKLLLSNGEKISFWSAKIYKNRTVALINKLEGEKNNKRT